MITRRGLLMTGGAAILVAGGGAAAWLTTRSIDPVREPWRAAAKGGFGDPRLNAVAYAILAPSAHNRQPWWVELRGEDKLVLYCDLIRRLPEADPYDRQTVIGLGAFLELLGMAAAEQGYKAEVTSFPDGEPAPQLDGRPIAEVIFTEAPKVKTAPLFDDLLDRRTNRAVFAQDKPVTSGTMDEVAALSGVGGLFGHSNDPAQVDRLKALCREAWEIECNVQRTLDESTALTRIGAAAIRENPDGISVHGPMIELYKAAGFLSKKAMAEKGSTAHQQTISYYNNLIDSAMAFGWLVSPGNSRVDQLDAGAHWVRLNMAANHLGVAFQPLSQALEEFPEMEEPFEQAHTELGVSAPQQLQGLFRLGYAKRPAPSPRWAMESRIQVLR